MDAQREVAAPCREGGIMSENRIHLLGNGIRPKQKKNVESQNITVGEVSAAFEAERVENEKMVKWYMLQVPELVERMVQDAVAGALLAAGITIPVTPQPPESAVSAEKPEEVLGGESPPPVTCVAGDAE